MPRLDLPIDIGIHKKNVTDKINKLMLGIQEYMHKKAF